MDIKRETSTGNFQIHLKLLGCEVGTQQAVKPKDIKDGGPPPVTCFFTDFWKKRCGNLPRCYKDLAEIWPPTPPFFTASHLWHMRSVEHVDLEGLIQVSLKCRPEMMAGRHLLGQPWVYREGREWGEASTKCKGYPPRN